MKDNRYAFYFLNRIEMDAYEKLLTSIVSHGPAAENLYVSGEALVKILRYISCDNPHIFWFSGKGRLTYPGDNTNGGKFYIDYLYGIEETISRKIAIEKIADGLLAYSKSLPSEFEKVKFIYEWLLANTEYLEESVDSQNICSVFLTGKSVCAGYSRAAQYLLNRMGIFCTYIIGRINGNSIHAWNLVQVDGEFYHLDVTLGDPKFSFLFTRNGVPLKFNNDHHILYNCLCVTTEEIEKTHILNEDIALPMCTSEKYML